MRSNNNLSTNSPVCESITFLFGCLTNCRPLSWLRELFVCHCESNRFSQFDKKSNWHKQASDLIDKSVTTTYSSIITFIALPNRISIRFYISLPLRIYWANLFGKWLVIREILKKYMTPNPAIATNPRSISLSFIFDKK